MAAADLKTIIADDHLNEIIRLEIYRVRNATFEKNYDSPYGSRKPHEDLIKTCKACKRDTTELERALSAMRDAVVYLKHVTDIETSYLCRAADAHMIKPRDEDLT